MISEVRPVPFRFQLSAWTLFNVRLPLQVLPFSIGDQAPPLAELPAPAPGSAGLMLRSLPHDAGSPGIERTHTAGGPMLAYVMQCFPRYFIDMGRSFDDYKAKFSGKTRSTLNRKVRKYGELCGGDIRWERFSRPEELDRFWRLAREVSAKTYQERLLDAGLPDDEAYIAQARALAAADNLRAFLLFHGERPVSYLFCPVRDGILEYAFLGYDPAYIQHSVGTVLQWLALESLFAEQRFRYFDFTEGESEHKRLFGTDHLRCVNLALLRPTLRNRLVARAHLHFVRLVEALGAWLERHQLRSKVRRWLRLGRIGG